MLIWSQLKLQITERIDYPVGEFFYYFFSALLDAYIRDKNQNSSRRVTFESYPKSALEFKGMLQCVKASMILAERYVKRSSDNPPI